MESKSRISMSVDALLPPEMAEKAVAVGVTKAHMGWRNMFTLAVLAGAFIAMGAVFATTVTTGSGLGRHYGLIKLLGGLTFSLGLILVVVAGAELFTGNNLVVMAWASRKVSTGKLIRNWSIVYAGNFAGSVGIALIMLLTRQFAFSNGAVGLNALAIANGKCQLAFFQAVALGMMCNALVCLAIWICFSARTTSDKILSIIFPITAFVASGFEHCIANMYFIPAGIMIKAAAPEAFWDAVGRTGADYADLTWRNFFIANLLPVTIGNIIGGSFMVGLVYWFIYIRKPRVSPFG
jgi:formate transporter